MGGNPQGVIIQCHTGLDPVSPANQKGVKLISSLTSVQLCDSGSLPGMTK